MQKQLARRNFFKATAAATAVVGFATESRAWVPYGYGSHFDHFDYVPQLDGELVTDELARDAIGQDVGFLVFKMPAAILRPGSIDDVVKMVRFCRARNIKVVARGQGHSTNGQSQAEGGLVIDMRSMGEVHEVGAGYAVVDGGATWRTVLETVVPQGQTPPVLTGFQGLSVGGTLSMGGISGLSYNKGVQVEHVHELWVVTGNGHLVHCSRDKHRFLYDAVLAGVGQYGIIVRAKLELVPAHPRALDSTLTYTDIDTFTADMRILIEREEFDMVWGQAQRSDGQWVYQLLTTSFYTPPNAPDTEYLLRGLSVDPSTAVNIDGTYLDYQLRVDGLIGFLESMGLFKGFMHPWYDVFIPDEAFETHVGNTLENLEPDGVGDFGFVLFFPLKTSTVERPLFRLPDSKLVYLFDVLTAANFPGFDEAYAERMIQRNRRLFDAARSLGGTRYPIGTLDFGRYDWRQHYGPEWVRTRIAKAYYDPQHILTPCPGIFDYDE